MRKTPIVVGMVIGAIAGLLTSLPDGVGLQIVMMSVGAVAGAPIGGAFSRLGKKRRTALPEDDESFGLGTSPRDRMRNFWRDKGRTVRFTEPTDFGGTRHDFDQ